jgi:hypothetical protein
MAARLKSFGAENGWAADVAFDLQLAATNSSRQKPEAEMTHVLERVILPYNDSEIRERAKKLCAIYVRDVHISGTNVFFGRWTSVEVSRDFEQRSKPSHP